MVDRFSLYLIKPSHYDDAGYVIQWFRSAIPSSCGPHHNFQRIELGHGEKHNLLRTFGPRYLWLAG